MAASATPLALVPAVSLTRIGSGRGNQISYQYFLSVMEEYQFDLFGYTIVKEASKLKKQGK